MAAGFQAFIDGLLNKAQNPRTGPFVIHLTPERYQGALMAAQFAEGTATPNTLHVSYESEPNVEEGDEVEIVVGEFKQLGIVVKKQPPSALLPPAGQQLHEMSAMMRAMMSKPSTGFDPAQFQTPEMRERLHSQWLLLLASKDSAASSPG